MKAMIQVMRWPMAFRSVPRTVGATIFTVMGLALFFGTIWRLPKLRLTETQLFFAMLLNIGVMIQMTVAGMVFDIHRWLKEHREES